jgi:hypothetical protein
MYNFADALLDEFYLSRSIVFLFANTACGRRPRVLLLAPQMAWLLSHKAVAFF